MPLDSGESKASSGLRHAYWGLLAIPYVLISVDLASTGAWSAGFLALSITTALAALALTPAISSMAIAMVYLALFALSWLWPGPGVYLHLDGPSWAAELPSDPAIMILTLTVTLVSLGVLSQGNSRRLVYALLLIAMGLVISRLSGEAGSPGWMLAFFRDTVGLSQYAAEIATIIVRKTIHFGFYGCMALSAASFASTFNTRVVNIHNFATVWTLGHAAFDEMRQSQTPSRTGTIIDVILDLTGVAFALFLWNRHQKRLTSR